MTPATGKKTPAGDRRGAASPRRINLALQGGGAHGAYTWGVLDRLLESDEVEIAAISGTSAGALNGAALKAGLARNGREGARETLNWLWSRMGAIDDMRMPAWMGGPAAWPAAQAMSRAMEYSLPFAMADAAARLSSPYAWGPMWQNPLRPVVDDFDYGDVCAGEGPELHVCATNVRDGKIRVFTGDEISTDVILASACLPTIFQAVELDDPRTGRREAFWDGGYTGNPALFPLFDPRLPADVVIVNINPLERDDIPVTPTQINNRINEISFNSSLLRELRAIDFVQRLIQMGKMPEAAMKYVLVHMISDDNLMQELSVATKLMPNPVLLHRLKDAGRQAAGRFLAAHLDDLGERSSTDLRAMFD
ncbi:patatin-like phospholipase family protein [Pseudooceanicola aestuarii]|uniref:patatin-like phospholipase family protein n=1 Tax=Pseudooceanicola aestuarii TaxID=2697319 RepID=UPI001EF87A30|nr:patatin-like phospholipase family protein [Pseudooceanicola aestuarii]